MDVLLLIASMTVDAAPSVLNYPWALNRSLREAAWATPGYMKELLLVRFKKHVDAVRAVASKGNMSCVVALVGSGTPASVVRKCVKNESFQGCVASVKCILDTCNDAMTDALSVECIGDAITSNIPELVKLWIPSTPFIRRQRNDPLMIAIKYGYAEVVEMLLDARIIVWSGYRNDPFERAMEFGFVGIMYWLMKAGHADGEDTCSVAQKISARLKGCDGPLYYGEEAALSELTVSVNSCNCNLCQNSLLKTLVLQQSQQD